MEWRNLNIRCRKDGLYEARVTLDGERHSCYGNDVTEVKRKLRALLQEYDKTNVIAKNIRLSVAMDEYLQKIKQPKVKSTTYDRVENTFIHHIRDEALGRKRIGSIMPEDIQSLLTEKCEQGFSASSIKKIYNLLGEFFKYAVAMRLLGWNPMELVDMPHASSIKYDEKEMEVLTTDELRRVIAEAERVKSDRTPVYRYGEAIILLLVTGLRSGELRGLNVTHIDFGRKQLNCCKNVTYSKDRVNGGIVYTIGSVKTNNSNRVVPLNDRAMLAIKRLKDTICNPLTGYLVCTSTGRIVTHSNLQKSYSAILKAAGVKHMGLHSTRHTFATVILKNAEDKGQIKEVSELLGHSKVSTTYQYYIKASDEDKRKLLDQLDALVS